MTSDSPELEQPPIFAGTVAPPTKSVVPPSPGEVITALGTKNTYTMGGQIGEGHFAIVYSCQDTWENELAAKVFRPLGTYDAVKAKAEAELAKLLTLRHPYITFAYDAFEYRDTIYIVTERCARSVRSLLAEQWFQGTVWILPIARCLLQAVDYVHRNNYAHQDIHAGNVLMSFLKSEMGEMPGQPAGITFKLADLGVARVVGELDAANTRAEWMLPPEVLEPKVFGPIDQRLDIYHVGLLLLQVVISKEIGFSKEEILAGKPREMALGLPAPYAGALEKALRRHAAFRTATAIELWRDLHVPAQRTVAEEERSNNASTAPESPTQN